MLECNYDIDTLDANIGAGDVDQATKAGCSGRTYRPNSASGAPYERSAPGPRIHLLPGFQNADADRFSADPAADRQARDCCRA